MPRVKNEPLHKRGTGVRPGERRGQTKEKQFGKQTFLKEDKLATAVKRAAELLGDELISAMTPLDVMIFAMRLMMKEGWVLKAADIAKDAAPYVHPRLANIETNANRRKQITDFSDDELKLLTDAGLDAADEAEVNDGFGVCIDGDAEEAES